MMSLSLHLCSEGIQCGDALAKSKLSSLKPSRPLGRSCAASRLPASRSCMNLYSAPSLALSLRPQAQDRPEARGAAALDSTSQYRLNRKPQERTSLCVVPIASKAVA